MQNSASPDSQDYSGDFPAFPDVAGARNMGTGAMGKYWSRVGIRTDISHMQQSQSKRKNYHGVHSENKFRHRRMCGGRVAKNRYLVVWIRWGAKMGNCTSNRMPTTHTYEQEGAKLLNGCAFSDTLTDGAEIPRIDAPSDSLNGAARSPIGNRDGGATISSSKGVSRFGGGGN